MEDIRIDSLTKVPFEAVADAFLEAFADYGMTLDYESLAAMLKRRGARFDLSFAAFAGNRIVSFIINGVGEFAGQTTAYDTGTGTVKEFRGRGLTDRIFNYSVSRLVEAGVERYLLEVLTHNAPAVKIYSRQGFSVVREFECYTAPNAQAAAQLSAKVAAAVRVEAVSVADIERHAEFMDFAPSWQNSLESVKRNPEAFLCLMAYDGERPIGWGVSETAYGDITLLAVDRRYRRRGVGSRLLLELIKKNHIGSAKVLNIEDSEAAEPAKRFLESVGFSLSCRQYEMVRGLQ